GLRGRDLALPDGVLLKDLREDGGRRLEVDDPARLRAAAVHIEVLRAFVARSAPREAAVEYQQTLLVRARIGLVDRRNAVHGDLEDPAVLLEVVPHPVGLLLRTVGAPEIFSLDRRSVLREQP